MRAPDNEYPSFLARKQQSAANAGFEPLWMPDFLFDFQRSLVEWAVRKGRAAIFADCGLGKTPMQLVWAENVVRHTGRPVLLLTTLGDSIQTVHEAEKFGVEAMRSKDGKFPSDPRIIVTNYERLHNFDPADFAGVVCNESSILKNFDGKTKAAVTEFLRERPYRLLCTATAAPNDYIELGTSSEALGYLGYSDMITRFFKQETIKDYLGWGRSKYRLRGHAGHDFWRWVCSWARAVRRPSDLGFDDAAFALPPLVTREHVIQAQSCRPGMLFDMPAVSLDEQREERRRTLPERCERVAEIVIGNDWPVVCWCHLNDEGDTLETMIPGSVQISGSDDDDRKEEVFDDFASGRLRVLITKPTIAGFGLNWQHCCHQTFFPSHSFEQWYQAIRRCWRFGQTRPVLVDVIASEGEEGVLANLNRKSEAADVMFASLVRLMNDELHLQRSTDHVATEELPAWLSSTNPLPIALPCTTATAAR
jgi:hypothetical protein